MSYQIIEDSEFALDMTINDGVYDTMKKYRKPWCPHNGCFMVNGAAPKSEVTCQNCGNVWILIDKCCPKCHTCPLCKRIGKRWYENMDQTKTEDPMLRPHSSSSGSGDFFRGIKETHQPPGRD